MRAYATWSVAGAGGFDVAAGTVLSLAGDVTGEGVLAKLGGGDLVLSGVSDVEWNVQAGGLTADAALFTGDVSIAAGAGLTFDQKADAAYAGTSVGLRRLHQDRRRGAQFHR